MTAWYEYPITNPHPPDDGIDIGAANDTLLTMPFGGHVIDASYHDYGGQVVVAIPGTQYDEYFIHLDDMYVQPGQDILPGMAIGTSGGGVGDKVLHNGIVQPAQYQSWYDGHSSGYHTEYGLFLGPDMGSFNRGWGNPARQLDPTPVYNDLRAGRAPKIPGATGAPGGTPQGQASTDPWWCKIPWAGGVMCAVYGRGQAALSGTFAGLGNEISTGITAGVLGVFEGVSREFGALSFPNFTQRLSLMTAGVALVGLGVTIAAVAFVADQAGEAIHEALNSDGSAQGGIAKAAIAAA